MDGRKKDGTQGWEEEEEDYLGLIKTRQNKGNSNKKKKKTEDIFFLVFISSRPQ